MPPPRSAARSRQEAPTLSIAGLECSAELHTRHGEQANDRDRDALWNRPSYPARSTRDPQSSPFPSCPFSRWA